MLNPPNYHDCTASLYQHKHASHRFPLIGQAYSFSAKPANHLSWRAFSAQKYVPAIKYPSILAERICPIYFNEVLTS